MINNFKQIRKLLTFNSDDEFYFVQILQRKKDNPDGIFGSNNSSRLIKGYYIDSFKKYDKFQEEMIFFANHFNARVGINLNKRSYYKTAFNTMKIMAEQMHNKAFKKVQNAWNRSCGIHNAVEDKVWLLDVDIITDERILLMVDFPEAKRYEALLKCINSQQPEGEKVITRIPSKSGYHLITKPFDTRKFVIEFPDIEIHKNNPTNLYIP